MRNLIIINGSPRTGGNSDAITAFAERQFAAKCINTEVVNIRSLKFTPCVGCDSCKKTNQCVFDDDATVVVSKLFNADGVLLALPLYYTNLPGRVKSLIDRFYVNYNPWQDVKQPNIKRKSGVILTFGGSPDEIAQSAIEVADYAFGDLGFGNHKSVLCGMSTGKDSFSGNSEQQTQVAELIDWLADDEAEIQPDGTKSALKIAPTTNPLIQKLGRDNKSGQLIYSASGIRFNAKFSELWVETNSDYQANEQWLAVLLNGAVISRFMVPKGSGKMCLLRGMNQEMAKEVTILRDTQAMIGETLTIPGIELDGELLPVRVRPLKIEIIGDSITSGEGAVGSVSEQDWVSAFFSAVNSYPWKLAVKLDADLQVFSQSGFGVTCSWDGSDFGALPKYYGQEIIFADAPHDFTEWQPDAVVINLGTNDFGANANPSVFKQGVLDFLKLVRKHNPKAYIVWAVGMAGRPFPVEIQSAIAEIADDNCGYLELPEQNSGTLGSRAHPGELCHEQAAQTLYEHLRSRLGA